jgi:hypothetical protein
VLLYRAHTFCIQYLMRAAPESRKPHATRPSLPRGHSNEMTGGITRLQYPRVSWVSQASMETSMHNSTAQNLSKGSELLEILNGAHDRLMGNRDGAVADYIPELAKVDVDKFGLSIATTNGAVYSVGHRA